MLLIELGFPQGTLCYENSHSRVCNRRANVSFPPGGPLAGRSRTKT
jgi:hypothetical protein